MSAKLWTILLLTANVKWTYSNVMSICTKDTKYEYDLSSCPGGIQLRNRDRWLSKSRSSLCICGEGSIIQFDGEDKPWHESIYPPDFPKDRITFLGSWESYNLKGKCARFHGNMDQPSALLIDVQGYTNPENFPTRTMELIVTPTEHKRLPGSYSIEITRGLNSRSHVTQEDLLKTVMINTREPALIFPDLENRPWDKLCAYNAKHPEVILSKYITSSWNMTSIVTDCLEGNIPPYVAHHRPCKGSCQSLDSENGTANDNEAIPDKENSFLSLFELMGEVSIRMKFAGNQIPFTRENEPHVAIMQLSSRLFFRAFPNVLKWETLLNAVTIFGIAFEGLIPNHLQEERFDQIRLALGRCTLQQERDREKNAALFNQICSALPPPPSKKTKRASGGGNSTVTAKGLSSSPSQNAKYNKLIDLLWKMVQFAQIKCLQNLEHHPNVHHLYVESMAEVFTSPAVQLLWYDNSKAMDRAMMYVLPELPDNSLQIIDSILEKTDYSTYFNILQRPKIENLEQRHMACAGHGKLIWGGKACCYFEEDDRKYRFYNRVAFAKL